MMAFLKNTRIKNKIIIIIFSVGALSAISGSLINFYYQVQQTKKQLVANTLLVSTMLSEYCGLPLEFGYPDKASEALEKLHLIPSVLDGVLFDANGAIFASYHKTKNISEQIPPELKLENTFVKGEYIYAIYPVQYKGLTYGSLYLRSYIHWKSILIGHLKVAISIIVVLLIVIYILSRLLHRSISEPIVSLTEKMNTVAQNKDYSIHFDDIGSDEIGELYTGFSTMLSEINKKENELKTTNESLRINKEKTKSLLDKIPYPISTANEEGFLTFINERFVQVFGYTEKDLPTIEDWWQKAYPNPDYREQVRDTWGNAVKKALEEGGDIEALEYEVTCKNGEKRIVEISGILLEDSLLATFIDLTEKKKAELALIESEERYSKAFNTSPYSITISDPADGTIIDVNNRFLKSSGYSIDDVIGVKMANLNIWHDLSKREEFMNELLKEGEVVDKEYVFNKKDGQSVTVLISATLININKKSHLLTSLLDITSRKKAELALKESEDRYSKAFRTAPYCITISDPDEGTLIDVNNEFVKLSGYSREEVIGIKSTNLNLWPNLKVRDEFVGTLMKDGEVYNKEFVFNTKNGGTITALLSAVFININNRQFILSNLLDITDRKKAEEALLKSEEKYRTIFENVQDVFFQTSMDGTVLDISPSIFDFLGIKRADMIGRLVSDFYYNMNDRQQFVANLQSKGKVNDYEIRLISNTGEVLYTLLNASIVTGTSGPHIQGVIRNITERKKTELIKEDLRIATSRLSMATNSAGIGIWEWDIQTEELIWSEEMHKLFGLDYTFQTPKNWRDHIYSDDLLELQEKVEECIHSDQELIADFRTQLPSGEIKYLQVKGNMLLSEQTPNRMLGACWDISDRKRSEELLLQSEATLYATINNTTFFIWSIDRDYHILNMNRPFKNFLKEHYQVDVETGKHLGEFAGQNVEEFSMNWSQNYIRALAGESFELTEERNERHFKYSLNPLIENAVITGVTVFMEEMTEIKAKEQALMKANEQIGELKVAALRSAMNPHFIFNTLNSILYFILKNDSLNAANYLSTFSKLIRSILNNSVNNKIRLIEEIDQIKNYVHLELLRFENKFDFKLELDQDLDVDNIEVSSMLIQPYIENAILHGLYNKPEKGCLKVSVKEEDDCILFTIEDNGIGRAASNKHNFHRAISHKSLGTQITEERLNLLKKQSGATIEIEDLYTDGEASGTRVKIRAN